MTDALQNSYATLEQKVEQRTKEISALYGVTTAVNQSLALEDILDAVIAKTTEMFHFESTRVFLFNDEMEELQLRASFEVDSETYDRDTGVEARPRCYRPRCRVRRAYDVRRHPHGPTLCCVERD